MSPTAAALGRLIVSLSLALPAPAAIISIGFFSHDVDSPVTGQTTITLNNLTGSVFGCTADFRSCTDLTISGTLDMQFATGPTVSVDIVDAGPGVTSVYSFASSNPLVAAAFVTGTTPFSVLTLEDGSTFTPVPIVLSGLLLPDPGISLLNLQSVTVAPEPFSGLMLLAGLGSMAIVRSKARRTVKPAGKEPDQSC